MTLLQGLFLLGAAALGGALNAVAGGGSFFSFPALLFVGVPEVSANATNSVALWPGYVASMGAYRRELMRLRGTLLWLSVLSLIGGAIGALLLLRTSDATFARMIPWLLLAATLIFACSRPAMRWLQTHHGAPSPRRRAAVTLLQLPIAIYGGFFGGGVGILMLAALSLAGMEDIHEMNGLKALFSALINGVAVLLFIVAGVVQWPAALVMIAGAIAGGYGGAALARLVAPAMVRRFVIAVGAALTVYFFVTTYGGG
jgi:uncharacterized membrane protein YfcA